jgi:hypothetical protein
VINAQSHDRLRTNDLTVFIEFRRPFFYFIKAVHSLWVESLTRFSILKLCPSVGDLGKGYDDGEGKRAVGE